MIVVDTCFGCLVCVICVLVFVVIYAAYDCCFGVCFVWFQIGEFGFVLCLPCDWFDLWLFDFVWMVGGLRLDVGWACALLCYWLYCDLSISVFWLVLILGLCCLWVFGVGIRRAYCAGCGVL